MSTDLRAPRRRHTGILTAALALTVAAVVPGLTGTADAADGRVFEMTSPIPERGHFLPGESIEFRIECLAGETFERVWHDELGGGGWAGGGEWGQSIDPYAPAGTYEWVLECLDADGGVADSETFTADVGVAASLVATVGTTADECADTDEIQVEAGTEVHWCYRLVPHPDLEWDIIDDWGWDAVLHEISDTLNGPLGTALLADVPELPADGVTSTGLGILSSSVVSTDVANTGTWSVVLGEEEDDVGMTWYPMDVLEATARVHVLTTDDETDDEETDDQPSDGDGVDGRPPAPPATPVTASPSYTG